MPGSTTSSSSSTTTSTTHLSPFEYEYDHNPTPAYILKWSLAIEYLQWGISGFYWWVMPFPIVYLLFTLGADLLSRPLTCILILIFTVMKSIIANCINHRFFAHRAWSCSRPTTLVLFLMACTAGQRTPLWWASKHSRHHKHCDVKGDPHSIILNGFWYAWLWWAGGLHELHTDWEYVHPVYKTWELFLAQILGAFVPYLELAVWLWIGGPVGALTSAMSTWSSITGILFFNVAFHHKDDHQHDYPPPVTTASARGRFGCWSSAECARFSPLFNFAVRPFVIILSDIFGELDHTDHHHHPHRAHRPALIFCDVAYWSFVWPGEKLGLFWNVQHYHKKST